MQILQYNQTSIPKAQLTTVIPKEYTVKFLLTPFPKVSNFKEEAKLLAKHMEIIPESRSLIKQGKTMTWEELKNEAKKR